jgi:Domain of unknown function (DUF4377)
MTKARGILILLLPLLFVLTACRDNSLSLETTVYVASKTVACEATTDRTPADTCLRISTTLGGPEFINQIVQFNHESGFRYVLRVRVQSLQGRIVTTSDINSGSLILLLEILEKTPAP